MNTNERKEEIRRYVKLFFTQLTVGCGYPDCTNKYCATSYNHDPAVVVPGDANKMGALALKLAVMPDYKDNVCRMLNPALRSVFKFPRPLTYDHFADLVQKARENADPTVLIREVGPVVGSPRSLGLSLLSTQNTANVTGHLPYETFGREDYETVTKFYSEIEEFDNFIRDVFDDGFQGGECVMDIVAERMLYGLKTLVSNPGCLLEPYAARMVIIPLLCPRITADIGSEDSLLANLARVVRVLPTGVYGVLTELIRQAVPHSYVRKVVEQVQNEIAVRVELMMEQEMQEEEENGGGGEDGEENVKRYNPSDDSVVTTYVIFLSLLYYVNELFGEGSPEYVKTAEWYNEPLSDCVDIRDDYVKFLFERSGFSFCRFAFVLSVELKSTLFRVESVLQQRRNINFLDVINRTPYVVVKVRRNHIVEDSIAQLEAHNAHDFKKELRVSFAGEDGIDMGGVKKEWFSLLLARLVTSPESGLFKEDERSRLQWFNPGCTALSEYALIGKLLAIAMYNGVILELNFPAALYKKLKGLVPTFDDLREIHPVVHSGLEKLLQMPSDDPEAISDLDLYFSVVGEGGKVVPLVPDGENVPVTSSNRAEYVEQYTRYVLVDSVKRQFEAFYGGFRSIFSKSKIYDMLTFDELERVICGSTVLNWAELEDAAEYENGFARDHPFVKMFWGMFRDLTEEQKRKFLRFATATERAPVGGLRDLRIVIVRNGPDSDILPTASTCFNHLLIPEYKSLEKLKTKFLQAIQYSTGFGLA